MSRGKLFSFFCQHSKLKRGGSSRAVRSTGICLSRQSGSAVGVCVFYLFLCANTYFDTICVHLIKICVQIIKMRTVKLTDKLEFT